MGLDGVELVMAVEEEFDIAIEDADAERIKTPRHLIDYVGDKVGCVSREHCSTQRAFHQLRRSLIRHYGLKRAQIRPQRLMSRLLPFKNRRHLVRQMLNEIGVAADPAMVRPRWLKWLIVTLSLAIAALLAECVSKLTTRSGSAAFVLSMMTFGGVAILLGSVAAYLTRPLRCQFQPSFASVGNFSRWMVIASPETFGGPTGKWTRDLIAEKIRRICIEQLGLTEGMYREDADFVKDLGVD